MTKETKDLFEYCKATIRLATKDINIGFLPIQISEDKAIKKLDELEAKIKEMEVYLTKGGIILDRNGKQCHVGDKVKWTSSDEKIEGTLVFDEKINRLFVDDPGRMLYNPVKEYIELIEGRASESVSTLVITPSQLTRSVNGIVLTDVNGNDYPVSKNSQAEEFFEENNISVPVKVTLINYYTNHPFIYKAEYVQEDKNDK